MSGLFILDVEYFWQRFSCSLRRRPAGHGLGHPIEKGYVALRSGDDDGIADTGQGNLEELTLRALSFLGPLQRRCPLCAGFLRSFARGDVLPGANDAHDTAPGGVPLRATIVPQPAHLPTLGDDAMLAAARLASEEGLEPLLDAGHILRMDQPSQSLFRFKFAHGETRDATQSLGDPFKDPAAVGLNPHRVGIIRDEVRDRPIAHL